MGRGRTYCVSVLTFPSSQIFRAVTDCKCAVSASSRPVPFKADISPRFPEAIELLAGERDLRVR